MTVRILQGDCREVLKTLPDASVHSIVTDPPYHLTTGKKGGTGPASVNLESPYGRARVTTGFMGMTWDGGDVAQDPAVWRECLRVLKPGGYLLAFGGSRTSHRMVCAIEDAGFEVRDTILWLYGSGFPKSHNGPWGGTALKPAHEPICMARKPLEGTVAANFEKHGTGALNIDGCRVVTDDNLNGGAYSKERKPSASEWVAHGGTIHNSTGREYVPPPGRWPANVVHDGSEEVLAAFPDAPGQMADVSVTASSAKTAGIYGPMKREGEQSQDSENAGAVGFKMRPGARRLDAGSAARFFYCAKANKADRGEGNTHPTVKPTKLMRWLVRLVTPSGGTVLDPFAGSGSAGRAASIEGFEAVLIELNPEYVAIAERRISGDAPLLAEVAA